MPVNKKYFDDLMKDRRISLRAIAREMNCSPSQLSRTFGGYRRMQLAEAATIARMLGVPVVEVMVNAGIEEVRGERKYAKVIGFLKGDLTVSPVPDDVRERVPLPIADLPPDTVAIQARTANTPFSFLDGWVFFVGPRVDASDEIGSYCVAHVEGGDKIIGTLSKGYQRGTYNVTGAAGIARQSMKVDWVRRIYFTQHS